MRCGYTAEAAWDEESGWALFLLEQADAVEAKRTLDFVTACSVPHMKDKSRADTLDHLRTLASDLEIVEEIPEGQEHWTAEDRFWKRQRARVRSWFFGKTKGKGRA